MSDPVGDLLGRLERLPEAARAAFRAATTEPALNQEKAQFLGKKGELRAVMAHLRDLDDEGRRRLGQAVNETREAIEAELEARRQLIEAAALQSALDSGRVDLTLPAVRNGGGGSLHPLVRVRDEIVGVFQAMGFEVATGPEVETDFHNFEALNFPPDHPARDMQDTLLLENGHLLRTHTSPVQIRTMLRNAPPVRVIAPGAVYRCDDDITHSPMFSQVEGLLVDEGVSMADLKGTLQTFASRLFGRDVPVRLRPSFFPFTEPSCEVDIGCVFCPPGGGCRVCHDTTWVEILGAGMVDPNVFASVGYDPERYTGFAFGLGVERVAMLKYGIDDIRLFFENDLRFLRQF